MDAQLAAPPAAASSREIFLLRESLAAQLAALRRTRAQPRHRWLRHLPTYRASVKFERSVKGGDLKQPNGGKERYLVVL